MPTTLDAPATAAPAANGNAVVHKGKRQPKAAQDSGPPPTATLYSGLRHGLVLRWLAKITNAPSGDQERTVSPVVLNVSWRGSPPAADITNTSSFPMRLLLNATSWPSGEKRGKLSRATWAVSRVGFEPSWFAIQMSPWYENTSRPPATCG